MRALRYFAALVLSVSLVVGTGAVASAAPSSVATEQDMVAALQSLAPGEELVLGNALVIRTAQGLVVHVLREDAVPLPSSDASFCGVALAAAVVGIGAGILGVIAAATGPGTVVIAGYLLTGAQVGALAGMAGAYAALLAWISRNIC